MNVQTILNVDDKAANRYLKSRTLRSAGFQVIEAGTGRAALEAALQQRPDAVLLDLKLPDISGFEVCRILKNDPKTRHIPVVHISATFVGEETKANSAQAGADIYLAEPVAPHELTSTVQTVLRLRATERTLAESEARLRLATEGAGIATWDLPVRPGPATWSAHFYAMLGLDPQVRASIDTWLERVARDEREAVAASLMAALQGTGSFALEHWIERGGDGEARCLAVFGTMQHDDAGQPKHLIGVAMDITERKRAEAEREEALQRARIAQQAAEDAARMKDEFLAILSHELRTPMAAVLGWLHLARSGELPPEEQAKALAIVERNAQLQVQLVNDLLDVSRIITGKLELERDVVAIDRLLRGAVESARVLAGERGVRLALRLGAGPWTARGSANRLEQVFGNLLANAVKFSREGGTVAVSAEREDGHAVITVTDEGEGIDPALLPHIFENFRQADSSTRRRHGGLGLGLAIVRSLVELHGGHVVADSEGPGKGSRFTVALPLLAAEQGLEAGEEEAVRPLATDALRGVRVLVVEDEADHRELVRHILAAAGATVRAAGGAEAALRLVAGWRPELMVLDIAMPDMDGYELLARLRRVLLAAPPAIALTGFAAASDAARALQAGFQAHHAKPFQPQQLLRTAARLARKP